MNTNGSAEKSGECKTVKVDVQAVIAEARKNGALPSTPPPVPEEAAPAPPVPAPAVAAPAPAPAAPAPKESAAAPVVVHGVIG